MVNKESFTSIENKWAVLIGVNNYDDATIRSLDYSVSDIKLFYSVLIDEERGKFDSDKVRLLIQDDAEGSINPTRSNILSELKHLSRVASKNEGILIYFSGHGFEDNGKSYLLPSDASVDVLSETAVSIEWLNNIIEESDARIKVMIFDACHSGARLDKEHIGPMKEGFYNAIFKEAEGKAVLSSSKINESSHEWHEKKQSVFTYFLVEGMRGKADYDKDGIISITDINRYVTGHVKGWSFKAGVQQTPTLQYWVSGDIILSYVPIENREPEEVIPEERDNIFKNIYSIGLREFYVEDDQEDISEICASLLEWFNPDNIKSEFGSKVKFPYGDIKTTSQRDYRVVSITFTFEEKNYEDIMTMLDSLSKKRRWHQIEYTFTNRMNFQKLIKIFRENHIEIISFKPPAEKINPLEENIIGKAEAWGIGGKPAHINVKNSESGSKFKIYYLDFDEDFKFFENNFFEKFKPESLSFLFNAFEDTKEIIKRR
ncbi:MAG: caspase family protein [Halobacteriota archaeon]